MIETCLDECGINWILCHNPERHWSIHNLHKRPVLSLCFRLSVARFLLQLCDSHDSRNRLTLDLSSSNRAGQLAHYLMNATSSHQKFKIEQKQKQCCFLFCTCQPWQAQSEKDELGWGRLDRGVIWTGPAKGQGAADSPGATVKRKQTEAAADWQHPSWPWKANCKGINTRFYCFTSFVHFRPKFNVT